MKITDIKQQVRQPGRVSIYLDGKYAFGLSQSGLLDSGLFVGQDITPADLKKYQKLAASDKAHANALRYVTIRLRSQGEMTDYFRRKGVDRSVADKIIDRLTQAGLLDDLAFARAWVAGRQSRGLSSRRLRAELQQKRISPDIIHQVLDQNKVADSDALRQVIAKKQARYPDKQKFIQYLARQGFGYQDIENALQKNNEEQL